MIMIIGEGVMMSMDAYLRRRACVCNIISKVINKILEDKTWSSVSNSNLSKSFVLGSLESLEFRSSVLSLKRSISLKFGSENILVPRKILGLTKICI